jgi:hypothetical protein
LGYDLVVSEVSLNESYHLWSRSGWLADSASSC